MALLPRFVSIRLGCFRGKSKPQAFQGTGPSHKIGCSFVKGLAIEGVAAPVDSALYSIKRGGCSPVLQKISLRQIVGDELKRAQAKQKPRGVS